ncbi:MULTISPECIES: CRISPR-associated endonuclease Cas2 [Micromonosporaceae]|uniref:CRISPR-associated endonuclease Cas2 n=1 Tax=Micromonosporaceae TaxID=28056 RepID=UPI0013155301|nr:MULTISPECIES: CRISPR-associated endonuclease Cas2 [Micromonosporaceae]MDG4770578.1 CRISPR-associated endonuclease Cas2 [Solwaraspora sp. WMMD792]
MGRVGVALTTVLVCYDISRDSRRLRVAAALHQWGERIQRSVFLCQLDRARLPRLAARLEAMIDVETDTIHIVPICAGCQDQLVVIGQHRIDPEPPYWVVL